MGRRGLAPAYASDRLSHRDRYSKDDEAVRLSDRQAEQQQRWAWQGKKLLPVLRKRIRSTFYIVQQCLTLATYKGSPFDQCVSVQRTADGLWDMTGIVAKVAPKHTFVTNVAQGGSKYQLHTIAFEKPA